MVDAIIFAEFVSSFKVIVESNEVVKIKLIKIDPSGRRETRNARGRMM